MAKKRGRETAYDMVLSMGAVFIAAAVILVIAWRPQKDYIAPINYEEAIAGAALNSNWPVLVPKSIPEGFNVTSARLELESYGDSGDTRWYLGFATDDEFISLWQSDGKLAEVLPAAIPNSSCDDSQIIAGNSWQKCIADKPKANGFVRTDGDLIYIVSGTVDWTDLENFINSLSAAS